MLQLIGLFPLALRSSEERRSPSHGAREGGQRGRGQGWGLTPRPPQGSAPAPRAGTERGSQLGNAAGGTKAGGGLEG